MSVYAVAISGGVDSAVTAMKLLQSGHDVFGVTMIIDDKNTEKLLLSAKSVTEHLKISHYICDLRTEFKKEVIDYFVKSYQHGLTPNPCAICNKKIKLHKLLQFALDRGADFLATGHYARISNGQLYESANVSKDQSYFLSLTSQKDLNYVRCPLQNIIDKSVTRKLAKAYGLPNFAKLDSQDICFVPNNDYVSVVHEHSMTSDIEGNFILNSRAIGKHKGLIHYTIGQRRGLGISHSFPLYVVSLNWQRNTVTLGKRSDLLQKSFAVENVNILADISQDEYLFVKIRSGHKKFKAQIKKLDSGLEVILLEPNTIAICPGQVCAVYNEEGHVLCGGTIAYNK